MKKLIIISLALFASGCAQLQTLESGISLASKSIANPVTKQDEANIEVALGVAVDALKAYKKACATGTADKNCKANVKQIQAYTIQVPSSISLLRNFIDTNDQINAAVVYNQLVALYGNVKTYAATAGVSLGAI